MLYLNFVKITVSYTRRGARKYAVSELCEDYSILYPEGAISSYRVSKSLEVSMPSDI
jgi:hypothetical protein